MTKKTKNTPTTKNNNQIDEMTLFKKIINEDALCAMSKEELKIILKLKAGPIKELIRSVLFLKKMNFPIDEIFKPKDEDEQYKIGKLKYIKTKLSTMVPGGLVEDKIEQDETDVEKNFPVEEVKDIDENT